MSTQPETLTPLAAIRHKESEMAQRLLTAQNEAAQAIMQARQKAHRMIAQATHDGQQAGEVERQAKLTAIEQEAQAILAQARTEADRWHAEAEAKVATAVTQLIDHICLVPTMPSQEHKKPQL